MTNSDFMCDKCSSKRREIQPHVLVCKKCHYVQNIKSKGAKNEGASTLLKKSVLLSQRAALKKKNSILTFIAFCNKNKIKRVLEVGCSNGALLDVLNSEGKMECFGIEIDRTLVKALRDRGLNADTVSMDSDEFVSYLEKVKPEAVIFNESLYYSNDPENLIKNCMEYGISAFIKSNQYSSTRYRNVSIRSRLGDFGRMYNLTGLKKVVKNLDVEIECYGVESGAFYHLFNGKLRELLPIKVTSKILDIILLKVGLVNYFDRFYIIVRPQK
jgi:hypothetical protein